jgi:hypothetical protein
VHPCDLRAGAGRALVRRRFVACTTADAVGHGPVCSRSTERRPAHAIGSGGGHAGSAGSTSGHLKQLGAAKPRLNVLAAICTRQRVGNIRLGRGSGASHASAASAHRGRRAITFVQRFGRLVNLERRPEDANVANQVSARWRMVPQARGEMLPAAGSLVAAGRSRTSGWRGGTRSGHRRSIGRRSIRFVPLRGPAGVRWFQPARRRRPPTRSARDQSAPRSTHCRPAHAASLRWKACWLRRFHLGPPRVSRAT